MRAAAVPLRQKIENRLAATSHRKQAEKILKLVMQYRRVAQESDSCANSACTKCIDSHLDRVLSAIERHEPIAFVLPAFPAKSPNPAKVLGPRPDMAERLSLAFLNTLCRSIKRIYAPGAQIILCSDGRVFSDVVGISECDVTTYQQDLLDFITALSAGDLTTFNLDDVFSACSFDEMRTRLMASYGEPIDALQLAVRADLNTRRLYCGITRFLFEDALRPNLTTSKTALQKQCRRRAYQVMQRSKAWDRLLANCFPNAVRLSIHPQACGSTKLGIHLMETRDEWLTPWHGVAVDVRGHFTLMKRGEVELLDAQLVFRDGRPSHYVLADRPPEVR